MIEKERIYNNSFRYKDVDDTYNPPPLKPYEVKNVKFKKFIWIKVKDIKVEWGNNARATTNGAFMLELQNRINEGLYFPTTSVPAVVNEKGELIAGYHRYGAHVENGEEWMWVALCEFTGEKLDEDKNQTKFTYVSEYDYNIEENNRDGVNCGKNGYDKDDVLRLVEKGIMMGRYKKNQRSIKAEVRNFRNLTVEDENWVFDKINKNWEKLGLRRKSASVEKSYRRGERGEIFKRDTGITPILEARIHPRDRFFNRNDGRLAKTINALARGDKDVPLLLSIGGMRDSADLKKRQEQLTKELTTESIVNVCTDVVNNWKNGIINNETIKVWYSQQFEDLKANWK